MNTVTVSFDSPVNVGDTPAQASEVDVVRVITEVSAGEVAALLSVNGQLRPVLLWNEAEYATSGLAEAARTIIVDRIKAKAAAGTLF